MRTWTWISEDGPSEESELKLEVLAEQINKLTDRWNNLEEQYETRRHGEYASGESFGGDAEYEMLEEQANDEASERGLDGRDAREYVERRVEELLNERDRERERYFEKLVAEQQVIEEMINSLGARFKRPYEHWNEEEKYMEFMENRYSRYDD